MICVIVIPDPVAIAFSPALPATKHGERKGGVKGYQISN
jgi:hypothetical protein